MLWLVSQLLLAISNLLTNLSQVHLIATFTSSKCSSLGVFPVLCLKYLSAFTSEDRTWGIVHLSGLLKDLSTGQQFSCN